MQLEIHVSSESGVRQFASFTDLRLHISFNRHVRQKIGVAPSHITMAYTELYLYSSAQAHASEVQIAPYSRKRDIYDRLKNLCDE